MEDEGDEGEGYGDGESVMQLLPLDSPFPLSLSPLPTSLVRFFDSLGLFYQGGKVSGVRRMKDEGARGGTK